MKTGFSIRVLLLLGAMIGPAGLWAQSTVSLRFWDAGVPVTNAQVSVEQGGVALGSGSTDANGQVTIPVPYLSGPSIDVKGTQQAGNTTRTWNLQGVVTLDARNSADVHLDQAISPSFSTMFPSNIASTWSPTTTPNARSLQPTSSLNLGVFSPSTNANPSLGGIDLNQILAFNNTTVSSIDIAGLQSAIAAMNSAGLGNSLNGYSIYMPGAIGNNTILKIPGNTSTPTVTIPSTHPTRPAGTPLVISRPKEDSTAIPKNTTKADSTQPKAVTPATKPRVKVHFKSETGEPILISLDGNQVNPTPTADVVAQLPIVYGLHPLVRVEFQNKSISAIEKTLTLSGTQSQYDFVVRKNAKGEWVVE